ncbi:hypothetical protein [Streptomyces sp. PAN_FS17]|nr:hypothetical protein [Streptomyces sp. PAN_FS17]SEE71869.1 hypothetical protein SAMN05428938_8295 [Streptomyces sp. KS_5]
MDVIDRISCLAAVRRRMAHVRTRRHDRIRDHGTAWWEIADWTWNA